jgi:hypothetical protein
MGSSSAAPHSAPTPRVSLSVPADATRPPRETPTPTPTPSARPHRPTPNVGWSLHPSSAPPSNNPSQRPQRPTPQQGKRSQRPTPAALRSSLPPSRASVPPPAATPTFGVHSDLRMNMPPMGSNRASSAPLRAAPAAHTGPSRSALASAAAVAAMIVAAVVAGVSWFGQPDPATLHVTTQPLDCAVAVDGMVVPGTASPFVATELAPDVDHEVEVSRAGYRSWRTRLRLRSGAVVALPEVQLQREGATSASTLAGPGSEAPTAVPAGRDLDPALPAHRARAAAAKPTQGTSAPRRAPSRVTRPRPQSAPAAELKPAPVAQAAAEAASARAASDDADGTLRINSRPWSRVYIDGRLVGNTPQMQLTLSPGWHTVTLVNPDFGVQKVLTIRIKPGEVATKIVDLGG